jgi:hypothetical protein
VALSADERMALARSGVEMYDAGDFEGALAMLHPEIEGYSEGLNRGHFSGLDGFARWAGEWNEAWESVSYDVEEVEPIGERHVVVSVQQTGRGRDSGIEVTQRTGFVFEVDDDGLSVFFGLYLDPERALAAAREREGLANSN